MDAFLLENLQYPEEALAARKEATVKVQVTLDHKGKVIEAKALDRPGFGLEEEAERVASLLRFSVHKNRGMRVTFNRTVKVPFRLPAQPVQAAPQGLQYSYRPAQQSSKKQSPTKKPAKTSYTYRINL